MSGVIGEGGQDTQCLALKLENAALGAGNIKVSRKSEERSE